MSENTEGPWLFEFEDGQSIRFAVHEAVEDRDECIELIEVNHGMVTGQLEDADFVLFSHQTPGVEELLEDGRVHGKPALDINWIHRCRGVERIVPWYSFQIGTHNFALGNLSSEARDEHEMVLFMARYGPILTLKQSFRKLEHMFPHRSARKFRDLYTQRSPHLTPQITNFQQRLESVLKPPLRLMPTKPRLNFSCSVSRPAFTFDVHTNALGSLNLCETQDEARSQTPPSSLVLPSASMTSHFPSSSPGNLPALRLCLFPPDDNTKRLGNTSTVIKHPQTSTHNTLDNINNHTPVTAETSNHDVLHAGPIAAVTYSFGPPQIGVPRQTSSAEENHWAAAVEYTATHKANWKELAHWKGFIRWYSHGNVRSPAAWQTWFKRRGTKFVEDVEAKRALDLSGKLEDGETSKTRPQNYADDVNLVNDQRDGDEDVDAIVEYLLANPCKLDQSLTDYWKGFQTSYKNGESRTALEWSLYYHHNFQVVIKPKVEKRVRELNVEVVLRIKDEEIWISGKPGNDREPEMAGEEQGMGSFRQESAVKTKMEGPRNRGRKNATTNHSPGKKEQSRGSMTFGEPYSLEEDVAIVLYLETHPHKNWTREKYWRKFVDWFPPANRPVRTYAGSARRRQRLLSILREKVREARARGIGTSESPEEAVKSLVRAFLKRKRGKCDEDGEGDAGDLRLPSKRPRIKDQTPTGDQLLAEHDHPCHGMSPNAEVGDSSDSLSSSSSTSSKPSN